MPDNKTSPTRDELVEMLDAIIHSRGSEQQLEEYFHTIDQNVPHSDFDSLCDLHDLNAGAIIDDALAFVPVIVNHPLLDRLKELSKEVSSQFSTESIHSLDDAGFAWFLNKYMWGGYEATPLNSVSFASTGGDGDHFSFLVQNDAVK